MSEEISSTSGGLDQDHVPIRPGELENQARNPGPAADVQQRGSRFGNGGEEHEGLEHEVPEAGGETTVGGEPGDPLPSLQFVEIRRDRPGKSWRQLKPERRGGSPDGALEVAWRRHR